MSRTRIFEYCVVGVLCRSLFVSDHSRLSTSISPASECKAICGSCQRYECGPWMKYQSPVRLSLNLNPWRPSQKPRSLCLCAFFLSLWFLRSNCPKFFICHLGWPNLWWNTENPVTLRSRAASLFSLILHHFSLVGAKLSNFGSLGFCFPL